MERFGGRFRRSVPTFLADEAASDPSMGHRALVAYRQSDGTFTLRYAHWGENLDAAIGPETPLGGPATGSDADAIADALDIDARDGFDPPRSTRVDPRPLAEGVTADAVVDAVDASFEGLYVVSPAYEVASYLVCSLDPTGSGADLVFADPDGDADALRSWFVDAKSRLSAAVARDALSRESARATLRRALSVQATVYAADDASFLRDR